MSTNGWRTLFGTVAAVCAFLLAQPDVTLPPWAKVLVGAIAVAVAVVQPPQEKAP